MNCFCEAVIERFLSQAAKKQNGYYVLAPHSCPVRVCFGRDGIEVRFDMGDKKTISLTLQRPSRIAVCT